jgi:hypothetical protein
MHMLYISLDNSYLKAIIHTMFSFIRHNLFGNIHSNQVTGFTQTLIECWKCGTDGCKARGTFPDADDLFCEKCDTCNRSPSCYCDCIEFVTRVAKRREARRGTRHEAISSTIYRCSETPMLGMIAMPYPREIRYESSPDHSIRVRLVPARREDARREEEIREEERRVARREARREEERRVARREEERRVARREEERRVARREEERREEARRVERREEARRVERREARREEARSATIYRHSEPQYCRSGSSMSRMVPVPAPAPAFAGTGDMRWVTSEPGISHRRVKIDSWM